MTEITTDEYFGGCPKCGKTNGYVNVGRSHWSVCDEHKTKWPIGANLFSSWKAETEAQWRRNANLLEGYTEVEPIRTDAGLNKVEQEMDRVWLELEECGMAFTYRDGRLYLHDHHEPARTVHEVALDRRAAQVLAHLSALDRDQLVEFVSREIAAAERTSRPVMRNDPDGIPF